ncbi:EAL domain-containing protein [Paraburkholderia acidicola]|nr:EAL domain-containing protein [Paraburkholderia acidicola]
MNWIVSDTFQEDKATIRSVQNALMKNRIELVFQPVCSLSGRDSFLYYECLTRVTGKSDDVMQPGQFMPVLERRGVAQAFDHYIMLRVIELLREHSDLTLGVNISAASADDESLWANVLSCLSEDTDIANRLIVEVTETAPAEPIGTRLLARKLQCLGCRVAVDDFGAGYSLPTAMAIGHADIVKIDASVMKDVRRGARSPASLREFVEFAYGFGRCLIIEGIETEEDLALASAMKIQWAQGYHFGFPGELGRIV